MTYSHILSSTYVSVMNLDTGEVTRITSDQPQFEKAVELVRAGDLAAVEKLTPVNLINNATGKHPGHSDDVYTVWVEDGVVKYSFKGAPAKELHNAMTSRLIRMLGEGFNVDPMLKFLTRLMSNPSKTAIDELYLFLEATELPITDDGCFIAYKIVKNDYTSHYDSTFRNDVGTFVEMPRNEVDDNRDRTCSHGLHFCSKGYLKSYGAVNTDTDRLLLVKIDPADVVSIPSDYNNAKGRASGYLIWKDITEPNWRAKYDCRDYNTVAVEVGFEQDEDEDLGCDGECDDCECDTPESSQTQNDDCCPRCGWGDFIRKGMETRWGTLYQRRRCSHCGQNYYVEA